MRWESLEPKRKTRRKPRKKAPAKGSIAAGGSLREYPFLRRFYQHQVVVSGGIQKFLFFLIMATLLYAFVFGDAGAIRIISLKKQKSDIEYHLAMVDQDIASLEEQIARLKDDPDIMEKLGRERYGYVYPGDRVYRIVHPPKR
jgi:cell division protein FtsB